ncbi:MAG: GGDEF domain-containing protein [Acidobacteriaceae bacterium]
MFDLTSLPDLLALTVLVFVFWSILRSRAGSQLHAWLVGWVFILLHFAVGIFGGRPGGLQTFVQCVAAVMLALGGAAFIYAAGGCSVTRRLRILASTCVLAAVFFIGLEYYQVASRVWYYVAAAVLFAAAAAILLPEPRHVCSDGNKTLAIWGMVLAVALAALAYFGQQNFGEDCIFFVVYLLAGIQYWRNFHRRTTGTLTAVAGLVAWACVFPVGVALELLAPGVHIQSSVWNIPKYIVAIGILLTLLEEQIHRTEHLALHDPLTGLPNRRLLDDRLTKAVERAERNEGRVAVLLIDLDGFKKINDTYGHAVGDEVLRVVATRLQMRVRKADTIARTGGDEFVVVVSDLLQPHGAEVLAGKLMADLNEPMVMEAVNLRPCASIGVAIYPDDAQTAQELCEKADLSMYGQKRRDR